MRTTLKEFNVPAEEYAAIMKSLSFKPLLTMREASTYFGIGICRMDQLLRDESDFRVLVGNRRHVGREKFTEFLQHERRV